MVTWPRLAALAVAVALAVGGWWLFFRESEEQIVLGRLRELAECMSKQNGEKVLAMVLKMQSLDDYFAPRCALDVDDHRFTGSYTPSEIGANMTRARQFFRTLQFSVHDAVVRLKGADEAEIDFTGQVTGIPVNGDRVREIRELRALLRRNDGKWRFTAFNIRDVLRK